MNNDDWAAGPGTDRGGVASVLGQYQWLIVAIVLAVSVLGAAFILKSGGKASPATAVPEASNMHTVIGSIALADTSGLLSGTGSSISGPLSNCSGTGGYSDMSEGTAVTVKDGEGNVVATSSLGAGESPQGPEARVIAFCSFGFTVDVPDKDFYSFEVSHRGAMTFSREELESKDWIVGLSLGS